MKTTKLLIAALLMTSPLAAIAGPIGAIQTFDGDVNISDGGSCFDCYVNGWFGELASDAGQNGSGDNAIRLDSNRQGFHLLTFIGLDDPAGAFLGDYLDAGVLGVQFDALHEGGADLFLRAFLFDDFADEDFFGGTYSSTGAEILADANEWVTYTIMFGPDNLILSSANYDPNQTSEDILSDVWQFGLRHDPGGEGPGSPDFVQATVLFDNLQLVTVPEPGSLALFAVGLFSIVLARRRTMI